LLIALVGAITIALQALKVIDVLTNLTDIWFWIAAVMLGIAANLLTKGITIGEKKPKPPEGVSPIVGSKEVEPLGQRQLEYRAEVRADLHRIALELYDIKEPRLIQFESWNAFTQPDPRQSDIHNAAQYDAIQNLSTALNARNKYVNGKIIHGDQDRKFLGLNNQCIAMYEKVRETGFLDVGLGMEPAPQYNGLLEGDVQLEYDIRVLKFDIRSTTDWFEVGLRNSRKLTVQKSNATKGKMLPLELDADLAGQYFRIRHEEFLEVTITATFEVYSADFVVVFLRKGDEGVLTVQVLDDRGRKLGDPYSYSLSGTPRNHVEFSREFR
jgi:hypothetical protein